MGRLRSRVQDRIFSGLRSYAAAKLATQVFSWIGTVLVVRVIDSEALGLFAIAFVIFNYASLIFEGGFAEALVQRPPEAGPERQAVFTMLVGAGAVLAVSLVLISGVAGYLLAEPAVVPFIAVSAVSLVMTSLAVLPYAQLARSMSFSRLAAIDAAQGLITTLLTVALAYAGYGAWALMSGAVLGAVFRTVSLNLAAPGSMLLTRHLRAALRYVRFGGLVFADAVLWLAYTTADTLLLGRWAGATALGYYRLGQEVANLGLEKVSTIVNQVALPAYADLGSNREGIARLSLETIRTHAVIGFPVFWGLAAVSGVAVPVLFGERWSAAVLPLMAFAIVAPLRLITSIESPAMTGTGRPDVLVKTKLFVAPIMIAAVAIGSYHSGVAGAAWAWLIVFPSVQLVSFHFILSTLELHYRHVWPVVRGALLAGLLMGACVAGVVASLSAAGSSQVFQLLVGVLLGAVVYSLSLRALDREAFHLTLHRFRRVAGLPSP